MSEWNAMTYDGKDTVLRVVRNEAEQMFAMVERPETWESPTACEKWSTRDVVGHIIDTTEGYFRAFDAARGAGEAVAPHGLPVMSEKANEGATAFRGVPQAELVDRLRSDFEKMQGILEALGPEEWTGLMVTHPYMGPVPAFFYAAGQLMDYGVHSWDIRQASGRAHALVRGRRGPAGAVHVRDLAGHRAQRGVTEPFTIGIRVGGRNAGDFRVSVSERGADLRARARSRACPRSSSSTPASLVLTAFGRCNCGTVRGDMDLAVRYLNLFFRI